MRCMSLRIDVCHRRVKLSGRRKQKNILIDYTAINRTLIGRLLRGHVVCLKRDPFLGILLGSIDCLTT